MFIWIIIVTVSIRCCLGASEKRLLLNDPDVLNARLESMERKIQELTQQNQQLIQDNKLMSQDIKQLQQEKQQLSQDVRVLQDSLSKGRGSTYTRWGRTQCPANVSELVYTGFAAGQRFDRNYNSGGPSNTLCLPRDPDLSNTTLSAGWSRIYGTEYEGNIFAHDSHDNDMPCSICRNDKAVSTIMIPGRRSCYSGWVKEYQGTLASGREGYTPSTYICIDSSPEYLQHGEINENGHLFYATQTKCGPLPCPPYHDNVLVECVVCSK